MPSSNLFLCLYNNLTRHLSNHRMILTTNQRRYLKLSHSKLKKYETERVDLSLAAYRFMPRRIRMARSQIGPGNVSFSDLKS